MRGLLCTCAAIAALCGTTLPAFGSDDALADLALKKKLSNAPAAYQDKLKPGAMLTISRNGGLTFYDADEVAKPFSVAAMKGPLPTITIESIESRANDSKGIFAKFLSWAPGIQSDSLRTLKSDQAVLSVASLDQDQIDELVYKDPRTRERYETFNRPGRAYVADVYIIEAVYWATELQITSASSRGINAATGGSLPKCSPVDADNSNPAGKPVAGDGTKTAGVPEKGQPTGTTPEPGKSKTKTASPKGTAQLAGQAALQAAAKSVASVASAAVSAAGSTTLTLSGSSCVDVHDVAHLKSSTPVPVAIKVDLLGYWNTDPDYFDWSPVAPPRF